MALPPTVPSSFVPYPGSNARRYRRADLGGAFGFLAYGIFFIMVVLAIGVFVYGRILVAQKNADDAALAKAEAQLDPQTVNSFVRLENRLRLGGKLLDNHVALSNVLSALGAIIPSTVQLTSVSFTADTQDTAFAMQSSGVAASLNALAQFSNDLGAGGKFKNVIVSNIKVNQKDNSVTFSLNALVDPSLVAFSATGASGNQSTAAPAGTSSATSTQP